MYSNTRKALVAATALAAVTWFAVPANAQRGRGGDQGRGSSQGQSSDRHGGERRAAQPRQEPPRQQPAQAQQARPEAQRPQQAQPAQRAQARPEARPQQQQQQQSQRYGGAQTRQVAPSQQRPTYTQQRPEYTQQRQAVPRQVQPNYRPTAPSQNYRGTSSRAYGYRGPSQGYYSQRYYSQPRYLVRPYVARRPVFVQPYYAFRPRFSLSFGFRVGYGTSYPFSYWDPNAFYNYHLGIQPGYNYTTYYNRVGGVSFEIDPYDAEVYVDGDFVGYASDFGPEQMPLTLLSGRHHVDIAAPGYQDVSFDITVVPGQVIPYQGTLPFGDGYGR